jgi:hypothetical protein
MAFVAKNYVDNVGPNVAAAWLNNLDQMVQNVLGGWQGVPTVGSVQTALGIIPPLIVALPVTISEGGTGAVDAPTALSNLGGTTLAAAVAGVEAVVGTQSYLGPIIHPRTSFETNAGVTPVSYIYAPGDIRRYGAVADAVIATGAGTDNSTAIAAALSCLGQPTFVPAGNWGFKNIVVPNGQNFYGVSIHVSNLLGLAGATGTMCTDNGSAAKTDINNLAFYCQGNTSDPGSLNVTSYTTGFKFGYGIAHGTEGSFHDIWVRALPTGFPGIDINSNIAKYGNIYTQTTGGLRISGTGFSIAGGCESFASSGFSNSAGVTVLTDFGDGTVDLIEVEAGATGIVPLFLTGNCSIGKVVWAPSSATTVDHVVQIGAGATTWSLSLQSYFQGTAGTITGGALKWTTSGAYYGGTSSGGGHGQDQNYFNILANATSGTAVFAGVTAISVTFPQNVATTTYKITLSQSATSTSPPWWTSKSTSGFTINFSAAFTGSVDWTIAT